MIKQEINLNMIPDSEPVVLRVDQYDTGISRIIAHLYEGDKPYTPASGATCVIQGTKPDNHGFSYTARVQGKKGDQIFFYEIFDQTIENVTFSSYASHVVVASVNGETANNIVCTVGSITLDAGEYVLWDSAENDGTDKYYIEAVDTTTSAVIAKNYGTDTYESNSIFTIPSKRTVDVKIVIEAGWGEVGERNSLEFPCALSYYYPKGEYTLRANLTQQMTAVAGDTRTQFVVTETSGRTGTFAFILRVQESALRDDTDISDTELPAIMDLAETNAERAEAAASHYPYINTTNNHWMVWDVSLNQFVDTGVDASGGSGQIIQVDTLPTAGSTYAGELFQYVGATTASYTHGYFYECKNNGGTYSWVQTDTQPSSGGSDVEANPSGAATATLTKLRIGSTIYGIDAGTPITNAQIDALFPTPTPTPTLVAFDTGTDSEIAAMINGYYDGTFTLADIQSVWDVGDTRDISRSAIAASGGSGDGAWTVGESHIAQTATIQILDFAHDDLTTAEGEITKALITVDLKDCLNDGTDAENGYMGLAGTSPYPYLWQYSARRAWCNNGFYNALPGYIKNLVKPVDKLTGRYGGPTLGTTSDKVFFLSEYEIYGSVLYSKEPSQADPRYEGSQYELYETAANRYKGPAWTQGANSAPYWERSPQALNDNPSYYQFCCRVEQGGQQGSNSADTNEFNSIAPAFCM